MDYCNYDAIRCYWLIDSIACVIHVFSYPCVFQSTCISVSQLLLVLSSLLLSTLLEIIHKIPWVTIYIKHIGSVTTKVFLHSLVGEDPEYVSINGRVFTYLVADTQEPNEDDEDIPQTVDRTLIGGELCDPWSEDDQTTWDIKTGKLFSYTHKS